MTSAINPWGSDNKSDLGPEPSPTGAFNPFSTASTKKQDGAKKSFLPSWTSGEEEEQRGPQSVNDFLKQDRIEIP